MSDNQAIGTITIKRLRKGRNLVLGFVTDKALFQGWNPITKIAEPTFNTTNLGPTVTPKVYASDGTAVQITSRYNSEGTENENASIWYYNDLSTPISWDNDTKTKIDGVYYVTSVNKKWKLNNSTMAITFIADLASEDNQGTDTFYFKAKGEVDAVNYSALGSFEFKIQTISSSGFVLMTSGGNALTANSPTKKIGEKTYRYVTVNAHLYSNGVKDITKYIVWYDADLKQIGTGYSIDVLDTNVYGQGTDAGVYVKAFENQNSTEALATTFHQINDFTDNYDIELYISGTYTEWDGTNPIIINARVRNVRTQQVLGETGGETITGTITYLTDLYDSKQSKAFVEDLTAMPLSIGSEYWSQVSNESDMIVSTSASWA